MNTSHTHFEHDTHSEQDALSGQDTRSEHDITDQPPGPAEAGPAGVGYAGPDRPVLSRPIDNRMLGGVAAGLARYLGADVTIVRVIFVVLGLFGGLGVPAYIAAWLLIPEDGAEQSIASEFIGAAQARQR